MSVSEGVYAEDAELWCGRGGGRGRRRWEGSGEEGVRGFEGRAVPVKTSHRTLGLQPFMRVGVRSGRTSDWGGQPHPLSVCMRKGEGEGSRAALRLRLARHRA